MKRAEKAAADRKRARYVASTIALVLRQYTFKDGDSPVAYMSTFGQMDFIRRMLEKVWRTR